MGGERGRGRRKTRNRQISGQHKLRIDIKLGMNTVCPTYYSGTSDKGPCDVGTISLQRTLVAAPC